MFSEFVILATVYGVEYSFGAHEYPTSGVFEVEPQQCPGFKLRKSIFMGTTKLSPFKIREFMAHQSANYHGDTYHLIVKNCNHFCEDMCQRLTGNSIPKWVNRLARLGIYDINSHTIKSNFQTFNSMIFCLLTYQRHYSGIQYLIQCSLSTL